MRAGEGDGTECVARISRLCEPGENPGEGSVLHVESLGQY